MAAGHETFMKLSQFRSTSPLEFRHPMKAAAHARRPTLYGSFYWRLGISFLVFVLAVLVAQSVMFSYILAGANARNPSLSPNNLATSAAGEVGAALTANPDLNLRAYLTSRYGQEPWPVFVVMNDGSVSGNSTRVLSEDIRRSAESALRGTAVDRGSTPAPEGPVVTAPIQVGGELRGLVVLPPPPPGGVLRDVGRLLSLPGTIVLVIATLVAVVVIFAPARRRLSALEDAAERLGAGDLTARAPDRGGDEIARVSRAFNRMAEDLAARDEALRTSDRLRRQMLADVSHELKTPLTAMRGYVETLRMSEVALDDDRRARYLETIASETLRLDRIVKDLLDLARYENNVAPLEVRVFDVGRLLHNVARRHEHEMQRRHITVSVEIEPAADQIVADPDRIEQVVENLVTNAVRHTPESGRIELRAAITDASAVLSVADSGDGIAPEHLPYVFDRFYKVDPARAAGGAGSGLGLSIVRAIVVRHGGTIAVASAPGSTTFTISLPQSPHQKS
jgi:two-component system, OmpR family, sensor kinase